MYSYLKFSSQVYHNTPMPHTQNLSISILLALKLAQRICINIRNMNTSGKVGGHVHPSPLRGDSPASVGLQSHRSIAAGCVRHLNSVFPRHCCRRETLTTRDRQTAGFSEGGIFRRTDAASGNNAGYLDRHSADGQTNRRTHDDG